jgi:hypothetical protein
MAGLDGLPYTPVPASLRRILERIPQIGTPRKADATWLAGLGFSGGNNQMNLALLRQVGIINNQGVPTDMYKALRAGDRAKFGAGIRKHYANLFSTYPDAQQQDDEALIAFVRGNTDYAEGTQRLAVRTFRVFAEFSDFDGADQAGDGSGDDEEEEPEERQTNGSGKGRRRRTTTGGEGVALTVNIQLQLPPSADGEVYDKLFEAMGKHLKGLVSLE